MWANCEPCSRWFFVPFGPGEAMARAQCSVCMTPAAGFEVRLEDSSFSVDVTDADALAEAQARTEVSAAD